MPGLNNPRAIFYAGGIIPQTRERASGEGIGRLEELYPWIYPPLDSYPISLYGTVASVANGATATILDRSQSYRGSRTRLTAFGVLINNSYPVSPSGVLWTLLINGRPTPPVTALAFQYGTVSAPTPLSGVGIIVGSGDDLQLRFTNNSGGALANVEARLDGYAWTAPVI